MPQQVQIGSSSMRGSRDIEHIGSTRDDGELEVLKAAVRQRMAAGKMSLARAWSARSPRGGVRAGGLLPILPHRWPACWALLSVYGPWRAPSLSAVRD